MPRSAIGYVENVLTLEVECNHSGRWDDLILCSPQDLDIHSPKLGELVLIAPRRDPTYGARNNPRLQYGIHAWDIVSFLMAIVRKPPSGIVLRIHGARLLDSGLDELEGMTAAIEVDETPPQGGRSRWIDFNHHWHPRILEDYEVEELPYWGVE